MGESALKIVKKKAATVVAISGPMTIDHVGELRSGLLKAFGLGKKVEISLAAVTDIDLTGLQLLCSSHRTSIDKGLGFSVTGADGEALSTVAGLTGMLRHIGCDPDVGGTCIWKRET